MSSAEPLENPKWELFAQRRASGATLADAWNARSEPGEELANAQARSSGSRCEAREEVAARIAFLRSEIGEQRVSEHIQLADPISIMVKVSDVLKATYEAANTIGAPEGKLSKIRACWSAHVARMAKMKPMTVMEVSAEAPTLFHLKECKCPT